MTGIPLISAELFDYLKRLEIEPFAKLIDEARPQLGAGVRVISLLDGEKFSTQKPGQRIMVLSGEVMMAPLGSTLDADATRDHIVSTKDGETLLIGKGDAVVLLSDEDQLDNLASWGALARFAHQDGSDNLFERLMAVKDSIAFRRLPLEYVIDALQLMSPRPVRAGDEVVRQGEQGDSFYLIWSGRAEVWKMGLYDDAPQLVATLGHGDTFGDEALVTGGTRNATVRMVEDGELLVLGDQAFKALMSKPMIEETTPQNAVVMLQQGWQPLDVRYEEEFEDGHIPGAYLLPLHDLRELCDQSLDRNSRYLAVCRSGKRSAVAAFLLSQRGYQVVSMKGGMHAWEGATNVTASG